MVFLKMSAAVLLPIVLTGLFTLLQRKTKFSSLPHAAVQVIIGLVFGGAAILLTEFGVPTGEGVIMNVRDSAPLCAGLIFGGPAGIIAGVIGGGYRWLCVFWGGGMLTRTACAAATVLAGIFGALMRRQIFEGKKPGVLAGFGIGATMEVLHMLLIISTNLNDVSHAFSFVQVCAFPMILCNGLAVGISAWICSITRKHYKPDLKNKRISYDFTFWLLVCVVVAFIVTSLFTQQIVMRITTDDTELFRNVTLYLVVFMEILIFTALFILIYQMLKKKVVKNLRLVNEGLNSITNGNLDTVIDVRAYKEFSELSDDVNDTVSALKHYIKEAEERMDKELELARQIQHSVLPSVFPPYPNRPDFDLYASMDAAKEVGGDFYDFYLVDPTTLVFMVADVSGKGVPAALFMMTAKTLIKGLSESGKETEEIFNAANRKLCAANEAGMFITAWLGKLDLTTGNLEFVNAGHNPPLIRRRGGRFEYLRTKANFVLAGMEDTVYRKHEIQLEPDDTLFLYTDGVTEAANPEQKLFGEDRLEEALKNADPNTRKICEKIKADVIEYADGEPQSDDITMLCVKMSAICGKFQMTSFPDANSCAVVQAFLEDRLRTAEVDPKLKNKMFVVADEIWSNIVNYSGADKAVLKLGRDANTVLFEFIDNGMPFDPTKESGPDTSLSAEERQVGGLGIHMVMKMASSVKYMYEDGNNRLIIGFDC